MQYESLFTIGAMVPEGAHVVVDVKEEVGRDYAMFITPESWDKMRQAVTHDPSLRPWMDLVTERKEGDESFLQDETVRELYQQLCTAECAKAMECVAQEEEKSRELEQDEEKSREQEPEDIPDPEPEPKQETKGEPEPEPEQEFKEKPEKESKEKPEREPEPGLEQEPKEEGKLEVEDKKEETEKVGLTEGQQEIVTTVLAAIEKVFKEKSFDDYLYDTGMDYTAWVPAYFAGIEEALGVREMKNKDALEEALRSVNLGVEPADAAKDILTALHGEIDDAIESGDLEYINFILRPFATVLFT